MPSNINFKAVQSIWSVRVSTSTHKAPGHFLRMRSLLVPADPPRIRVAQAKSLLNASGALAR